MWYLGGEYKHPCFEKINLFHTYLQCSLQTIRIEVCISLGVKNRNFVCKNNILLCATRINIQDDKGTEMEALAAS